MITLQYCNGFCHTSAWISHSYACVPSTWTLLPPPSAPHLRGERKLAKMACSGSLAPHFVNNDYVTAEVTYNTAHAHHKVLLTWSWATLCYKDMNSTQKSSALLLPHVYVWGTATRGENCGTAVVPARRENKRDFSYYDSTSSSSLLAHALPNLGSTNSVHSEIQQYIWCHEQG